MAATPATCAKDMRIFACQLCGALINRTANEVSNTCGLVMRNLK